MMEATYSAYESYKDSGEGWIENVPAHWETRKLKQLFQEKRHRQNLDLNCGSISFGEVVEKDDERVPLATKASYQEVSRGEFLVNPLNLNYDLKSLRIGLSDIDVVVSAGYLVLQAKDEMDKRYFKYLLHRYDVAYMKLLGSGVRQTISFNHIANSILVAPPLHEQRAIAAFLDDKCVKIDGAVKIKEDQIALLRERRQIIIHDAVTRGLNPAATMKESNINWIGPIPVHWELKRGKFLFAKVDRPVRIQDDIVTCFRDGQVTLRSNRRTEGFTNALKEHGYQGIRKGDLVIHAMDAFAGAIGVSDSDGKATPVYSVCIPRVENTVDPHFFAQLMRQIALSGLLVSLAKGIRERSTDFRYGDFASLLLIVPPLLEQKKITAHIQTVSEEIENIIEIKLRQIAALKEYKTSLINAAVTGKIKVI